MLVPVEHTPLAEPDTVADTAPKVVAVAELVHLAAEEEQDRH